MNMCKVAKCEVNDCAYNQDNRCHTMAVTIGDSTNPRCDTFCQESMQGGESSCTASVGACKVSCCTYNSGLECQAPEICVGYMGDDPDCLTFHPR